MTNYRASVLVIEDDAGLVSILTNFVGSLRLNVQSCYSGINGLKEALSNKHQLFIIDLGLGDIHGFELIDKIREKSNKPIIVITGDTQEDNEINSFRLKANIYHKKPINFDILEAQIESLLSPKRKGNIITTKDVYLDLNSRTFKSNGKTTPLTKTQFNFIAMLLSSNGQVFTRKQIINNVMDYFSTSSESCVDTMISRIRKKLEEKDLKTSLIRTVNSTGYKLNPKYYKDVKRIFS
jgi:DNA-binding response OmpR family regulator